MSPRRPKQARTRPPAGAPRAAQQTDMWRPVPQVPEPEPITPATDPTALLRSLGDPPLPRNGLIAGRYLATVVERAAALATALAVSADLLADDEADRDGG